MSLIKKDVAILCQYFYPEHVSSATLPTELAVGLKERGVNIEVICGYPNEYVDEKQTSLPIIHEGVPIHRVKYSTFNNKSKFGRIFNFFSLFIAMLSKIFYMRKFNKIIVYSNPPILPLMPYVLKKVLGIDFIFVAFDIYPDNALKVKGIKEGGLIHKLMNFINRRVYKNADSIVLLGREMKDYVLNNDIAVTAENLTVIPNWFTGEDILNKNEIINEEFLKIRNDYNLVVSYSGNMGSFQDLETILKGISRFKNSTEVFFLFSGHGNKLNMVKEYLVSNDIKNAKVNGFLKGQDYSDFLEVSDLCLVSLQKGIEGLGVPSKTYGYLAAGKPVLSIMKYETDIAQDIAEFNCGINILQGDIDGFVNAVNLYKNNPTKRAVDSKASRNLYEAKYTKDINVQKYYCLLS